MVRGIESNIVSVCWISLTVPRHGSRVEMKSHSLSDFAWPKAIREGNGLNRHYGIRKEDTEYTEHQAGAIVTTVHYCSYYTRHSKVTFKALRLVCSKDTFNVVKAGRSLIHAVAGSNAHRECDVIRTDYGVAAMDLGTPGGVGAKCMPCSLVTSNEA